MAIITIPRGSRFSGSPFLSTKSRQNIVSQRIAAIRAQAERTAAARSSAAAPYADPTSPVSVPLSPVPGAYETTLPTMPDSSFVPVAPASVSMPAAEDIPNPDAAPSKLPLYIGAGAVAFVILYIISKKKG